MSYCHDSVDAVRYRDPITSAAMRDATAPRSDLGMFPQLGFTIPILGIDTDDVLDAANLLRTVTGHPRTPSNPASSVWGNVKDTDYRVLQALNVRVQDGWRDATSGRKLSYEEADYRAENLMASLVGAYDAGPGPGKPWFDNVDGHQLTNAEAWGRWLTRYGKGATLESVLSSGVADYGEWVDPGGGSPGTPSPPMTRPPAKTPTQQASVFTGISPTTLLIAGGVLVGWLALSGRRRA